MVAVVVDKAEKEVMVVTVVGGSVVAQVMEAVRGVAAVVGMMAAKLAGMVCSNSD